jgi:hypothetical protein
MIFVEAGAHQVVLGPKFFFVRMSHTNFQIVRIWILLYYQFYSTFFQHEIFDRKWHLNFISELFSLHSVYIILCIHNTV